MSTIGIVEVKLLEWLRYATARKLELKQGEGFAASTSAQSVSQPAQFIFAQKTF
jgi:hypothetical protein